MSSHRSGAYAPEMSTDADPARGPSDRDAQGAAASADETIADADDRRAEAFWAAFDSAAPGSARWTDSARAAWRPNDSAPKAAAEPSGSAER